jgi:hypothetical protein
VLFYFHDERVDALCERVHLQVDVDEQDNRGKERENEKKIPHGNAFLLTCEGSVTIKSFTI